MFRNQQNLYPKDPTVVAKLLQYSGLGSNSGMGFLRTNDSQLIENGEFQFGFGVLLKTVRVGWLQADNKMKKNKKKNSLKHWATGFEVLR